MERFIPSPGWPVPPNGAYPPSFQTRSLHTARMKLHVYYVFSRDDAFPGDGKQRTTKDTTDSDNFDTS